MRFRHRVTLATIFLSFLTASANGQDYSYVRDGVELHYRTAGTGEPIVFLSGGPGLDVDYMIPVAEFVPASYRRVFYEQRGTGRSLIRDVTADKMTLRQCVEDLEALRRALGQERLTLLGHSWGAMLAMAYAAAYPNRVDRLILVGSGEATLEHLSWFEDNIRARLRPEDIEAERYWTESAKSGVDADKVAVESMKAIVPGYFYDRAKALVFAAQMPDGSVHAQAGELLFADLQKSYDLRNDLRRLDRPVLIVHGHQDPMGDKTAEDLHALLKTSTLRYIDKCGHFPWIEQPDELRRVITEFLNAR